MWRPAHGATSRPGPSRPASGYGRVLGRPGPEVDGPLGDDELGDSSPGAPDVTTFGELVGEVWAEQVGEAVEAPAPVTP